MLDLAVITDIHYGIDTGNKLGGHAPDLLSRFIRHANRERVDAILDLGDRISTRQADHDIGHQESVSRHFNRAAAPVLSIDGNHDVARGPAAPSSVEVIKGFSMILWNPHLDTRSGLKLGAEDLRWLRMTLAAAPGPAIVCSHVPLDNKERETAKSLKIDRGRFVSHYENAGAARDIMERSGKVVLCLAGHIHRNRFKSDDRIYYLTQQSLVQRYKTSDRPRGAYAFIGIDGRDIVVHGHGLGQPSFTLNRIDAFRAEGTGADRPSRLMPLESRPSP